MARPVDRLTGAGRFLLSDPATYRTLAFLFPRHFFESGLAIFLGLIC